MRHHRALPYAQIASFMAALHACPPSAATLALEFTVLTACRTNEVRGARWDEIDLPNRIWTIPPERMKAGKEHRVPLSDRAVELLSALPREVDNLHVFIGPQVGSSISTNAIYHALRQIRDDIDVHGFRATFSTWAHETTAYPAHVIEQSLAHAVGSAVERAYRRGDLFDKRRRLMAEWAKFCSTAPAAGDVVLLRGAR
jgi:integrase